MQSLSKEFRKEDKFKISHHFPFKFGDKTEIEFRVTCAPSGDHYVVVLEPKEVCMHALSIIKDLVYYFE